jgi:hypothetical protein
MKKMLVQVSGTVGEGAGPDDHDHFEDNESMLQHSINRESGYSEVMSKKKH